MKQNKTLKITLIIAIMLLFNISTFITSSKTQATTSEKYDLQAIGGSVTLLKYQGEPITSFYVGYAGKIYNYPAYCLDKNKEFITNKLSYSVTKKGEINDTILWRYIINGYPYKSSSELGCIGRDEAYVATQQAIYCYIYNQKIEDYEPIGEAGERTIQAMKNIIKNAQSSEETPISQAIKINKTNSEFKQDSIEPEFISQTYQVTSTLPMESYKVIIEGIQEEEKSKFKITDTNNNPKTEYKQNEEFKVLLPIEEMKKSSNFKITIQAKIQAKPVIYAIPEQDFYQDFAIPGTITEEIINKTTDEPYPENKTTIKIIKQDKETKESIEGAEFEILDSNKNIIYKNLKTNIKGEIIQNNITPGTYYIRETKAKDGYILSSELIKITVDLNQTIEVKFYNSKENPPETNEIKTEKKLPVTGM